MKSKKGKAEVKGTIVVVCIVLIALVVVIGGLGFLGVISVPNLKGGVQSLTVGSTAYADACPDTKSTSTTVKLWNGLNTTGSESFDASWYLFDTEGNLFSSGTATNGTAMTTSPNCGEAYKLCLISGDGSGGDNAKISAIRVGVGAQIVDDGKCVAFMPTKASYALELVGTQHGVIEAKVYDKIGAGWAFDADDLTIAAGTYTTTGAHFASTVNGTNYTVGSAGEIDVTFHVRATVTDERFDDFGTYIAVDAATTVWNIPTVKVGGVKLADYKGSLNVNEARAYSGYEYVFFSDTPIVYDDLAVDFNIKALAGVNPAVANSPGVVFISRGAVKQTSGNSLIYGGVGDDTSATTIFTIQSYTIATA